MSQIPTIAGVLGSAAGAPLSQTSGSSIEKGQRDSAAVARQADADAHAEQASGIGETEEDQQSSERDADGRRLLERATSRRQQTSNSRPDPPRSKDATGESGNSLDLVG